ncbi:MAG: sigma-70 family RNA polymerase sigma factor [Polyangiaceae bacterium]|nr:sigma-70 family RNA polymerase sigma factor [Polyangiaceae bacterium]
MGAAETAIHLTSLMMVGPALFRAAPTWPPRPEEKSVDNSKHQRLSHSAHQLIHRKARRLVGTAGFAVSDVDDIEQELALDLLERLPKFDQNRAAHSTFVARLLGRKISNLIRHRTQELRDYRRATVSLNDLIDDGDGGTIERAQTVPANAHDRRTRQQHRSEHEQRELRLDVRQVVGALPEELKSLAELLMEHRVARVARMLNIPRATLYRNGIARLRAIFDDAGLREYV